MRFNHPLTLVATMAGLVLASMAAAQAQCALPYTLSNGQPADATQLMANFNALVSCLGPGGSPNAIQYNNGGTLGGVGPLTNGQVVIGSTGNVPQAQTLTGGTGVTVTNGPGSATISATPISGASGIYNQMTSNTPTWAGTGLTNWLNQGSSTATDTLVGATLTSSSSGGAANNTGRFGPAPTAPYTITALVASTHNSSGFTSVSLAFYDGSAKLQLLTYAINNGTTPYFFVGAWSSVSFLASSQFTSSFNVYSQPIWLQIKDDGTNVSFGFSHDGANFLVVYSVAKASGYLGASGYSNVVFTNDPRGVQTIGTILSWTRS